MAQDWYLITEDEANVLERIVVPGGWLYRSITRAPNGSRASAMTFVPEPRADDLRPTHGQEEKIDPTPDHCYC